MLYVNYNRKRSALYSHRGIEEQIIGNAFNIKFLKSKETMIKDIIKGERNKLKMSSKILAEKKTIMNTKIQAKKREKNDKIVFFFLLTYFFHYS